MPARTGIKGYFGEKVKTYADYAASGQVVPHVEAYLLQHVAPYYANTHTECSDCGRYMNSLYQQARTAVAEELAADRREYAVIFTGSGATGALHKLALTLLQGYHVEDAGRQLPVVFVGPHEHHSNEVMWRELDCKLVVVPEASSGRLDLGVLAQQLLLHKDAPLLIGSFSAGSNVTGITEDVAAVAEVMHRHGGLACFDYAGAGSHMPISMAAPAGRPLAYKDAIVMSPHKMLGGPGACGLLVAARKLFHRVPTVPGGGTVAFVTATNHHYSPDEEHREEAGTPNILGAIRCGAAFVLRASLSARLIHSLEAAAATALIASLRTNPNIVLLGAEAPAYHDPDRMAIVSLLVKVPWAADLPGQGYGRLRDQRLLHHHFVCKLLNDVYGIQGRSGCSCAGPYGQQLLGIDQEEEARLVGLLMGQSLEAVKPGWMRLSVSFQQHPLEVQYIAAALHQVAEHGWRLLPQYHLDALSAVWTHRADMATTLQTYYPTCDLRKGIIPATNNLLRRPTTPNYLLRWPAAKPALIPTPHLPTLASPYMTSAPSLDNTTAAVTTSSPSAASATAPTAQGLLKSLVSRLVRPTPPPSPTLRTPSYAITTSVTSPRLRSFSTDCGCDFSATWSTIHTEQSSAVGKSALLDTGVSVTARSGAAGPVASQSCQQVESPVYTRAQAQQRQKQLRPRSGLLDARGAQDPAAVKAMRRLRAEYAAAERALQECLWRPARKAGEAYGGGQRQPTARALGRVYKRQLLDALELYGKAAAWVEAHRGELGALEAEAQQFTGALEQSKWWVQPAEAARQLLGKLDP